MKYLNTLWVAAAVLCCVVLTGFKPVEQASKSVMATTMPGGSAFSGDIVGLDTVVIRLDDCEARGHVCLPLSPGQAMTLSITDNGQPVMVDLSSGCDFDTTSAYTYSTLFGMGNFGPYQVTSWPVGGQVFQGLFNTMPELVDSMNTWDPLGNWLLDPAHLLITGGNPGQAYDTMKVWVVQLNTPSFIGYNFGTTPRGTDLSFERGFHQVILEDAAAAMRDTFYVRVACNDVARREIKLDSTGTYCLDMTDLPTGAASVNICGTTGFAVNFSLLPNSCVEYTGVGAGVGEACVVACDAAGFCDTTTLQVEVRGAGSTFRHFLEIPAGKVGQLCPNTDNLNGPVENVNVCNIESDGFAEFLIDPETGCITYSGLKLGGTDSVCVIVCDGNGVCDTTLLSVRVRRFGPAFERDTLHLNQTGGYCVDKQNLTGTPQTLQVFKQPNPLAVFYNLDQVGHCATYTGLKPGTDTLGLRLRFDNGAFDSTYLIITVLKPEKLVVRDSLPLGETANYCLDPSQLGGTSFVVDNVCKNSSNDNVAFDVNDLTLCVEMQALSPGTDMACMTLCDNLGVCDTVILIITAFDDTNNPQPPVATPDSGLSTDSQPVQLSVLTNDNFTPPFTDFRVLPASGLFGPMHGSTTVDLTTGTITYTPDTDFCNSTDNFRYAICDAGGCDTALVSVLVTCDTSTHNPQRKTVIYDAFSPNGDNVNDTFTILNVEDYPTSILRIYSRWGTEVFSKVGYENDWTGTWNDKPLPDGLYFYYFNNGFDRIQKGTIVMKR
ncbi:MAG: gliding motility-associated C-terminal domain-containing protein [Saprospiraceae bacterium]